MKKILILIMVLSFGFSTLFADSKMSYDEVVKKIIEIEHSPTKTITAPSVTQTIWYFYVNNKYHYFIADILMRGEDVDTRGREYYYVIFRSKDDDDFQINYYPTGYSTSVDVCQGELKGDPNDSKHTFFNCYSDEYFTAKKDPNGGYSYENLVHKFSVF